MNLQKEINVNKKILVVLILLSVITVVMRSSYSLFFKKQTIDNVLKITTGAELPSKGSPGADAIVEKAGTDGLSGIDPTTGTICSSDCKEYRYTGPTVKNYVKLNNNSQDELWRIIGVFTDGLSGIDPTTGTICSSDCKEYRYTGPTVKNYVKLTNLSPTNTEQEELWRIIGVFTDEETGEKYLRIVRDNVLDGAYFPNNYVVNSTTYKIKSTNTSYPYAAYWNYIKGDTTDKNDWAKAGLQYWLNSDKDSGSNKGYMSYLSEETKSMLRETKHYLGNFDNSTDTPILSYKHEREVGSCQNNTGTSATGSGCRVWSGNAATWTGKISLMYPSDVGFAASSSYWNSTKLFNYNGTSVQTATWMLQTMGDATSKHSWILSPSSNFSYLATHWNTAGFVNVYDVYKYIIGVRPVLNLLSRVKIVGDGDGSETFPYLLSM